MGTLADLAGQALRRVRAQEAYVELTTAVQKSMLPTLPAHLPELEVAARHRPSREGLAIGGDWYDAFVLSDDAVALEIGDVQGHDVEAAVVTLSAALFASCTMLHFDCRNGQVTGTSAGHVPVLRAHKDGTHDALNLTSGPVLGVVTDISYPEKTFVLDRDSALVMVTDGPYWSADDYNDGRHDTERVRHAGPSRLV